MKLVLFKDSTGQSVAVNPEFVRKVVEKNEEITLIKLDKDDFIEVPEDFLEVVARIKR
jgi:hypothetical protein